MLCGVGRSLAVLCGWVGGGCWAVVVRPSTSVGLGTLYSSCPPLSFFLSLLACPPFLISLSWRGRSLLLYLGLAALPPLDRSNHASCLSHVLLRLSLTP